MITRSPGLRLVTPEPTSSMMPMNSWPMMSPGFMKGIMKPLYMCRSDPQMAVAVTRRTASRGSSMRGSGTLSMRMSRRPW
ncbi:hypothetical protein D3C72_756940 [compost metagenome]